MTAEPKKVHFAVEQFNDEKALAEQHPVPATDLDMVPLQVLWQIVEEETGITKEHVAKLLVRHNADCKCCPDGDFCSRIEILRRQSRLWCAL